MPLSAAFTSYSKKSLWVIIVLLFNVMGMKAQLPREIIGYYPSWQWYDREGLVNPQTIPYTKYSIINYSFFKPNPDGTIVGLDAWADENLLQGKINYQTQPKTYYPNTSLVDLAHQAGTKVVISIGGWTESTHFSDIAADAHKREKFASECRRLTEKYDLDGIDIDWEYPGVAERNGKPADKQNFTFLLRGVRDALNQLSVQTGKKYLLTAAFGASKEDISHIEWTEVSHLLDAINLMTYDFYGSWDKLAGHNSPLYATPLTDSYATIDGAVNILTSIYGVSPSKINIGAAFYGRSLKTKVKPAMLSMLTGKVDNHTFQQDEGSPLYYNILKKQQLFTEHWDDSAQVPYLLGKDKLKTFVSYDNPRSMTRKAQYVMAQQLRGVIIWEITGDCVEIIANNTKTIKNPLLDALIEGFKSPLPFKETVQKADVVHEDYILQQQNDSIKMEQLNIERTVNQAKIHSMADKLEVTSTIESHKEDVVKTENNENTAAVMPETALDFNIKPNDDHELILLFEMKDKRNIEVDIADEKGHILRGVALGELEDGVFQNRIDAVKDLPNGTYKVIFKSFVKQNGHLIKLSEMVKEWEKN